MCSLLVSCGQTEQIPGLHCLSLENHGGDDGKRRSSDPFSTKNGYDKCYTAVRSDNLKPVSSGHHILTRKRCNWDELSKLRPTNHDNPVTIRGRQSQP